MQRTYNQCFLCFRWLPLLLLLLSVFSVANSFSFFVPLSLPFVLFVVKLFRLILQAKKKVSFHSPYYILFLANFRSGFLFSRCCLRLSLSLSFGFWFFKLYSFVSRFFHLALDIIYINDTFDNLRHIR